MNLTSQIKLTSFDKLTAKLKKTEDKHEWIDYIISPIITVVILLIVYAIKGVYPFGRNTVSYYDMSGSYIPIYTYAWDVLHGKSGLYLNWYSGLGISMADVTSIFVLFPTNLLLYFTTRDGILYFMSFFVIIKFALCSFSMTFYYKKHYNGFTGAICSGLLYTFCGFGLQYYTNIFYFDLVMLFPLILWGFERLILEHKYRLYIILMFFAFFTNVQLVFMVGIYLILKGFFILEQTPNEDKGKSLRLFAFSTIIAAMMACVVLIPSIFQTVQSTRAESNATFNYIAVMKNVYSQFRVQKKFIAYGSEIAVGLLLFVILQGKKIIIKYYKNIAMIILLSLPIIHEGINKLWHAGSYKHFPVRFGYMLTFECIIFVAEFCNKEEIKNYKYIGKTAKLLGFATIPFGAYILFGFMKQFLARGIEDMSSYYSYWIYFLTFSAIYFLSFIMESKESRNGSIALLILIQCFLGCYGFVAPQSAALDGYRNASIMDSLKLYEKLSGIDDLTSRVKTNPAIYESNEALIYEQPSLAAWLYGLPADTENTLINDFGYDGMQSYVLDSGGTVFSDTLFRMMYLIDDTYYSDYVYNPIDGMEGVSISKYKLPFGVVVDNDDFELDDVEPFEFQNALFKNMTGVDDELISVKSADENVTEQHKLSVNDTIDTEKRFENSATLTNIIDNESTDTIKIDKTNEESVTEKNTSVEENKNDDKIEKNNTEECLKKYDLSFESNIPIILYLCKNKRCTQDILIEVNGKERVFESNIFMGLYKYPNTIRNGIVYIDMLNKESSKVTIYSYADNLDGFDIGIMDMGVLEKGLKSLSDRQDLKVDLYGSGVKINGSVNKSGKLFLPIGYSKNWSARVNGEETDIKPYINNGFVSLDVCKGNVDIKLEYLPKGLKIGLLFSVIGLLLFLKFDKIEWACNVNDKILNVLNHIFVYVFYLIVAGIVIVFYIIPIYIKLSL